MWAVLAKFEGLGIACVRTKLRLFEALVVPIGAYGCQIWGVQYLGLKDREIFDNPPQGVVFMFLRLISGCRRSTDRVVLLREFNLAPMQVMYGRLCARMWNRALSGRLTGVMRTAMVADVQLFRAQNAQCWTTTFLQCMVDLGLTGGQCSGATISYHFGTSFLWFW